MHCFFLPLLQQHSFRPWRDQYLRHNDNQKSSCLSLHHFSFLISHKTSTALSLSVMFLSGCVCEIPPIPTIYHSSTSHGTPSFLCSHISHWSLTSSLKLKFNHGQTGVSLFFVVHLRSRQTTLHHTPGSGNRVLFTEFHFNTRSDRAIEQQLSGRIIPGVPPLISHCVAHSVFPFFFFFSVFQHIPPQSPLWATTS